MTARLKLSWKVTSHPLVKEATRSLNASSKPKQLFNEKYSPERRASMGTCSQARAGSWRQGLGRAELLFPRDGDSVRGRSLVCSKSPFATLIYQISIFIHANGAEGNTNVKAKELTWNGAHSSCALPLSHETHLTIIWLKAGFPPKLYFESRSQQWQHQNAIWAWNWRAVR